MSRIIAIDYGRKRTGIAVSDTLQMIANGLTTVPTHQLLQFLLDYVAKEPVERILVGLPKQMNNEASENMKNIPDAIIAAWKKQNAADDAEQKAKRQRLQKDLNNKITIAVAKAKGVLAE